MRFSNVLVLALLVVLGTASPLFAQQASGIPTSLGPGVGAGIGMGLAIVGIGIGIGLVGHAALSGIARQPEQAGAIQGVMFILAGLVEGAGIIALVLCLLLPLIV
ncbi:MAG: ATP synthase F0 subunit C [Planctomycetia bacterium]|nr:ATP synthase F0 subunit C [Planctomycetia bacterium]